MSARLLMLALLAAAHAACIRVALAQPVPIGPEFQVNSDATSYLTQPAVASDGAGSFLVVWQSPGGLADPTSGKIQGRRYDASGAPLGTQFQLNSYTTGKQYRRGDEAMNDAAGTRRSNAPAPAACP